MEHTLNKEQVQALFAEEAVLLGSRDYVPAFRVAELFGKEAVDFTKRLGSRSRPGQYTNGFGDGDCTILTFTMDGFGLAASYHNVQLIKGNAGSYLFGHEGSGQNETKA